MFNPMKNEDTKKLLGKRLKSLRMGKRYTQEKLAEIANLHSKYVSSLECGRENPTLDVLVRLSEALDIELSEMFKIEHEEDNKEVLKKKIERIIFQGDDEKLKMAFKLLKAIFY